MKKLKLSLFVFVGLLILIQLFPVSRTNPEVSGDIRAPGDFKQLLRRSCYDCHSFETRWPWYSHVAPASWIVVHDVKEARKHLNFSRWTEYSPDARGHLTEGIINEVTTGDMPLRQYLFLHPKAKISQADLGMFKQWGAASSRNRQDTGGGHD